MNKLTKKEALLILPAVIDNEASEEEKGLFFSYIEKNKDVRNEYENALRIKRLLSSRLPKHKAPPHLRENIIQCIDNLKQDKQLSSEEHSLRLVNKPFNKIHRHLTVQKSLYYRFAFAAAVVLMISLSTIRLLDQTTYYTSGESEVRSAMVVEYIAAEHFVNSNGAFIEPFFRTSHHNEAEEYLASHHGLHITIPAVTGAEFAGIVMAEFSPGFVTPMLEYTQSDIGEIIYLYAFDMDHMHAHGELIRHSAAAEACVHHSDYYVAEISNHHVVSWKWDNTWYTAVSNHNGYDLAALVEPLWE